MVDDLPGRFNVLSKQTEKVDGAIMQVHIRAVIDGQFQDDREGWLAFCWPLEKQLDRRSKKLFRSSVVCNRFAFRRFQDDRVKEGGKKVNVNMRPRL